jgi:16S rRNA (cytosine967-C5)-methyltransferase
MNNNEYPREITRIAAIETLVKILRNRKHSNFVLREMAKKYVLKPADRALLSELVFGVLKNLSKLDYLLLRLLDSGKFPSYYGSMALRVGAFQIMSTSIPQYAAVDTTVEAMRTLDAHPKELALINAVLRKFTRRWNKIELPTDNLKKLTIQYSHPEWIVKRWISRYGVKMCEKILAANNENPPKSYRINTLKISPTLFRKCCKEKKYKIVNSVFPEYFNLESDVSASDFEFLREGLVSVQDTAFAIPIYVINPKADERILEIGAAPGGKTTHIIEMLKGETNNFFAIDISPRRMLDIEGNLLRLGHPFPNMIACNGTCMPFRLGFFDKIIIDAPCSSLGIIRRHPEIRWLKTQKMLITLAILQKKLIKSAFALLKQGGQIYFTTCTTEPEENQGAWDVFVKLGLKIKKLDEYLPEQFIEANGIIARTWPHRDNMDGSFTIVGVKE